MVSVECHSSTGLNAGPPCFKNEAKDQVHHLYPRAPKSATLTSVYALADACTSTVPISRRTFSDLLSARRGGGGGFYTKVTTSALANRHFSRCEATARDHANSLPVLESCRFNGETRSAKLRNPYGMMHLPDEAARKLGRLAEESSWKHYC